MNLGRLALLPRLLGFGVWWSNKAEDQTLVDISLAEQRILLTRDRPLRKCRALAHGLFVRSDHPQEQTLEVLRRLDLCRRLALFSRCVECGQIYWPGSHRPRLVRLVDGFRDQL